MSSHRIDLTQASIQRCDENGNPVGERISVTDAVIRLQTEGSVIFHADLPEQSDLVPAPLGENRCLFPFTPWSDPMHRSPDDEGDIW